MTIRPLSPWAVALAATVWAVGLDTSTSLGQDSRFEFPGVSTGLRDAARVFSPEAVQKAKAEIDRIERETKASVLIETVSSVGDEPVKSVAAANARRWGREGLYVLIDKNDHKFEIVPSGPRVEKAVGREDTQAVRDAFLGEFKRGKFDEGLINGVRAMAKVLPVVSVDGKDAHAVVRSGPENPFSRLAQGSQAETGLVARNQARLTLAGARLIVAGAEAKAAEMKLKSNIAVVDDGGHLLSFDRMEGARPASVYTAITKATSAATFRAETGPLGKDGPPDALLNLSLQNAAAASGGKVTTLHGGIPVVVDGQVIGAVGVGGGTGEQDAEVARAGIERFTSALRAEAESK